MPNIFQPTEQQDHTHQHNTETGATDTRDPSKSPSGVPMTDTAKKKVRKGEKNPKNKPYKIR